MTTVADQYDYVVGVDNRAGAHTYAVLAVGTGRTVDSMRFPASPPGLSRALAWIRRRADGRVLVAVEGTGSYGANLTRALQALGIPVCDVRPPKRASRVGRGKSDEIDAAAAARTALATEVERLGSPRMDGIRSALWVLLVGRRAMDARRTADRNALTAIMRSFPLGMDARKPLSDA